MDNLGTFDLILCHGSDYWFSDLVEFMTRSRFSHCGIVLRDPVEIDPQLKGLYLLESGEESFPDAENHVKKVGVQITDFNKWIKGYKGHIYVRKFHTDLNRSELEKKMAEIHHIIHDKPYDMWPGDLVKVWLKLDVGDNQRTNDFFCSALVSYVYSQLGILPSSTKWDLIDPEYLAENHLNIFAVNSKFGKLEKLK